MMAVISAGIASLAATALFVAGTTAALGASIRIPNGPGSNLVYSNCQACHDLQYVVDAKGLLPMQWASVLVSMQDYGLEISDQDKSKILKYLTTYLGQKPPPAESTTLAVKVDGKTVWQQNCAACHGAGGAGRPGYYPPLAGNPDLFEGRLFPVLAVLNGISGPITVKGQSYDGSMPAFSHLSDDEIASVVNFVRGAWGNAPEASQMEPVTSELVARQRDRSLSPSEVRALRKKAK